MSGGTRLSAWHYPAASEAWSTPAGRPCVVMAHGFGGTRDSGLAPFAERFQAAGADVLVFDYRGFGDSDGAERQLVDHRRHRDDYRAAVAHARTTAGIDPDRIVLWGTSYSGGHVVAVAADDPRVAGVIAQGAAMDGLVATLEILRYGGALQLLRLVGHGLRGLVAALLRRPPHLIPLIGPPGSVGAMTAPDALSGYGAITGPTFRNEMQARGILLVSANRPVTRAGRLRMPLLLVIAERDTIAPVSAVERVARTARGPVTVVRQDVGHFDIYVGEPFETTVSAEVEFLGSVLGATMSA